MNAEDHCHTLPRKMAFGLRALSFGENYLSSNLPLCLTSSSAAVYSVPL
jgi:hypothetical protein